MATTEKLTLTRILSNIKSIDAQIEEYMNTPHTLVYVGMGNKKTNAFDNTPAEDMRSRIQSDVDKIANLFARQLAMNNAKVKANAETTIELNGKQITIAEAIVHKHSLPTKKRLLDVLKRAYAEVERKVNVANEDFKKRIDTLSNATISQDITGTSRVEEIEKLTASQKVSWLPCIADPLNIAGQNTSLQAEIRELEDELDERLSVINATTIVEVTY